MLTCAHGAQAVGKAAYLCKKNQLSPRDIASKEHIKDLQLELNRDGQSIPRLSLTDPKDLVQQASIEASSTLQFEGFAASDDWQTLTFGLAQMLPLKANEPFEVEFEVDANEETTLELQLKSSSACNHFTPDVIVDQKQIALKKGKQRVSFSTNKSQPQNHYSFFCLLKNEKVKVRLSNERITGLMTVENKINKAVSNFGRQDPPADINIDSFEFWTPQRRPKGKNIALKLKRALSIFETANLKNGEVRPKSNGDTNAWVAELGDGHPELKIKWKQAVSIKTIKLFFDCDYDHALETTLMGHPESEIPFVVADYRIKNAAGEVLKEVKDNYQALIPLS